MYGYRPWGGRYGPLTRYEKLWVAHAGVGWGGGGWVGVVGVGGWGWVGGGGGCSDPDMHHGTCVTHVPWCMPGSLTSRRFLWRQWRGKRCRCSHHMRSPQDSVSGKRLMVKNTTKSPQNDGPIITHSCPTMEIHLNTVHRTNLSRNIASFFDSIMVCLCDKASLNLVTFSLGNDLFFGARQVHEPFHWRKCIWIWWLQIGDHYVQASICACGIAPTE